MRSRTPISHIMVLTLVTVACSSPPASTPGSSDAAASLPGASPQTGHQSPPQTPIDTVKGSPDGGPSCGETTTYDSFLDLAYANRHASQKLDLYVPRRAGPLPVVVWIHGGGWLAGDKRPAAAAERQATRGYAVASIDYRLSTTAKFPAQIQDVKATLRWLRANATTYGLDADRIAVWGASAGGHLAALAGTASDVTDLDDPSLGNGGFSSRVQAVIDQYGPTDFLQMDPHIASTCVNPIVHDAPDSPESRLLGCTITACPASAARANPITYATSDDPPFLIEHGAADCTVPSNQSEVLQSALAPLGVDADLELLAGAGHGDPAFEEPENQARVDAFLDRKLGHCN